MTYFDRKKIIFKYLDDGRTQKIFIENFLLNNIFLFFYTPHYMRGNTAKCRSTIVAEKLWIIECKEIVFKS